MAGFVVEIFDQVSADNTTLTIVTAADAKNLTSLASSVSLGFVEAGVMKSMFSSI